MNPTRWLFEYHAIAKRDEMLFKANMETGADILIDTLTRLLGCDLVPPIKDPETGELKDSGAKRMPLAAFINPLMFSDIIDKRAQLANPEPDETYESQVASFDDLVPEFDAIFDEKERDLERRLYEESIGKAIAAGVLQLGPKAEPAPSNASGTPSDMPPRPRRVQLENK